MISKTSSAHQKSLRQHLASITDLWHYRNLVRQLAVRDLKTRYKVSILGFFWSLLRPLLTIGVLALVFSFLNFNSTRYQVSYPTLLMVTYLPWFFFSSALLEATSSFIANANLVKKVYCPRAVFPVSIVAANLANFLLSLAVLLPILYGLTEVKPSLTLLHLPFIIVINTLFLLGLCLITSIANVIYRDTTQIMEFLVFVWFYLSPVLYDIYNMFEDFGASTKWAAILYFLNPMAGILEWYRYSLLSSKFMVGAPADGQIKTLNTIMFQFGIPYAVICSLLLVVFGYLFMKRLETRAVDEL